jgi:hypothetical protein
MRTNDGRINHLQRRIAHSAPSERLQDHIPDAAVGPPPKLPKDRVPVAKFLRKVAPRRAGSHQPKHRVEHAAMVPWRTAAATMDQERFEIRPLFVGHQSTNQGCSPQRAALNQFAILASIGLSTQPNLLHSSAYSLNLLTSFIGMGSNAVPLTEQRARGTCRSASSRQGDGIGDGTTWSPRRCALVALRHAEKTG